MTSPGPLVPRALREKAFYRKAEARYSNKPVMLRLLAALLKWLRPRRVAHADRGQATLVAGRVQADSPLNKIAAASLVAPHPNDSRARAGEAGGRRSIGPCRSAVTAFRKRWCQQAFCRRFRA